MLFEEDTSPREDPEEDCNEFLSYYRDKIVVVEIKHRYFKTEHSKQWQLSILLVYQVDEPLFVEKEQ